MSKHIKGKVTPIVPVGEAKRFVTDCLLAIGIKQETAATIADHLIYADYRGISSHGMNRLERIMSQFIRFDFHLAPPPFVEKETVATALVNGSMGDGINNGVFCMNIAIQKAKKCGVGFVCLKHTTQFGTCAYFTEMASSKGLIGFAVSNSHKLMVANRAKNACLGTNPIGVAAPGLDGDFFNFDIASSTVAYGQLEIQRRKRAKLPYGWTLNDRGIIETSGEVAMRNIRLTPLGVTEATGGFKGSALSIIIDVLSGCLSGGVITPNIPPAFVGRNETCHAYMAVDPSFFCPYFQDRMSDFLRTVRESERLNPEVPVLIPGDIERTYMKKVDKDGGIIYTQDQLNGCQRMSNLYKVRPLKCDYK